MDNSKITKADKTHGFFTCYELRALAESKEQYLANSFSSRETNHSLQLLSQKTLRAMENLPVNPMRQLFYLRHLRSCHDALEVAIPNRDTELSKSIKDLARNVKQGFLAVNTLLRIGGYT